MNRNPVLMRALFIASAVLLTGGCTTMTRIEGVPPGTTLALSGVGRLDLPAERELGSKATGQFVYMATTPAGQSLYGVLPLHVNGKTMAGSIIFFAPALAIGGFRDVYEFYQVDPAAGEIRFKRKEGDDWRALKPSGQERARAKQYFDALEVKCRSAEAQNPKDAECAGGVPRP